MFFKLLVVQLSIFISMFALGNFVIVRLQSCFKRTNYKLSPRFQYYFIYTIIFALSIFIGKELVFKLL